jgi:heme exporter protein A
MRLRIFPPEPLFLSVGEFRQGGRRPAGGEPYCPARMNKTFRVDGDLVADNLACRRGERRVFAALSCRLAAGGALLLTGRNGSGKSSLLRLLASLIAPAAGRLCWGGVAIGDDLPAYRSALHYVGHLDALKSALSPRETLAVSAALRGMSATGVEAALAAFALDGIADWPCRWLSAGQRRRLSLARLIATPAPIWLLDEPSAGLDGDGEARLEQVIATHRATGGRVAIATHTPLAVADAAMLVLDDFAAGPDDSWAAAF